MGSLAKGIPRGRRFAWGIRPSTDPQRARRILLSNRMSLACAATALAHAAIYPWYSAGRMSAASLAAACAFACVAWLNHCGLSWSARFLLPLIAETCILLGSLALGRSSGLHLFFIPSAWLVLILFDWEERKTIAAGVGICAALFLAVEAFGPESGLALALEPARARLFHFLVVAMALALQILIVLHFFLANRRTESALAEAGETARAADKAKGRFLATMSHEIRTPLNGILGMSSLLLKTGLREDQREILLNMQSAGLDLMAIIGEILDLSKIEAGKLRLERAPFDLRNVIEAAAKPFSLEARGKGIGFRVEFGPELPERLIGDPVRLKQALNSLLSNAIRCTDSGEVSLRIGRGAIAGEPTDAFPLACEVADTGSGLGAAAIGRLFSSADPDWDAAGPGGQGAGIGLIICRQIAEMMGGTLAAESVPGAGSVFRFQAPFPVAWEQDARQAVALAPAPAPDPSAQFRLLIVEDHPLNRKVLAGFLAQAGFAADSAPGGEEALAMHASRPYDLIFMDCHMPGMDGYACTRALRARPVEGRRPVILGVTADAMAGTRDRCLEAGMDDVVTKPIMADELKRALDRWLEKPAASAPPPRIAVRPESNAAAAVWVDARHLREMDEWIRAYDPGFWPRAQEQFRASAAKLAENLRGSLESGRAREAAEAAHGMKGLCLMMGLTRLADLCKRLEAAGAQPVGNGWRPLLDELEAGIEPSLEQLRRQVGEA